MTKLHDLAALGQAIWLDDIRRSYFNSGQLARLVQDGLRGLTSNPTIFDKAITGSADYDAQMRELVEAGQTPDQIYTALAIADIRQAADTLRSVYDATAAADGYVSLEVSPASAHNTNATIEEAVRLFTAVDRPNLMIKIPATPAGIPAIEAVIGRGINVNVTLLFSVAQYAAAANAYISGLEKLVAAGRDLAQVASVASFFVSRVDTAVDQALEQIIAGDRPTKERDTAAALLGKIATANAKAAYACFQQTFSGERWQRLEALGARLQRPLWASTGTKNPAYPDTLYVDGLIGPHTVNTLPPKTLEAVLDHAAVERTIDRDLDEAQAQLNNLAGLGIDLEAVTDRLLADGVDSFAASFDSLMNAITTKRARFQTELRLARSVQGQLAAFRSGVNAALAEAARERIVERIWSEDHTVWKPDPQEISNRLGWLRAAEAMHAELPRLRALADEVRTAGYTHALLLGMGGSSLAPEVLRKTFGVEPGYLDLAVLDSTDPGAVAAWAERLDPQRTLFIVSTKSGGTVETFSFFRYFYNWTKRAVGEEAGKHFIAITDPGSRLAELGKQHDFRAVLLNDPNIGGRYSALSLFGLFPAALLGIDLDVLLDRGLRMAAACGSENRESSLTQNPGVRLGVALAELADTGCDKATLITSPSICTFGDWVEQLVAESTGKENRGIVPVVGESVGEPDAYGKDRFFIYIRLAGDPVLDVPMLAIESAGSPVMRIEMQDPYDLGAQFFLWEFATVVAGWRLRINPFDQPNVESAKVAARRMVAEYQQTGALPEPTPALIADGIQLFADSPARSLAEAWGQLIAAARPGAYISIQAYIPPGTETDASLLALRTRLRERTGLAVTTGYGPRFLHSTGQLHKGDAGNGLFVQITASPPVDLPIPDEIGSEESGISFGILEAAQALGDRRALQEAGRRVIRFHIASDLLIGLARLTQAVE